MSDFLNSVGYNGWILPVLLALPVLGAVVIWAQQIAGSGGDSDTDAGAMFARRIAFWTLVLEFVVSLGLWWTFDPHSSGWQAAVDYRWIEQWGSRFSLGVDGISLMMVLLTTFLMPLAILAGWTSVKTKVHTYHALMLVLTTGMLGVFVARDLFLFYVFWEIMLVPMYFIIGIWGGERRIYASIKFFIYTMVGSMLMLVAILWLGVHSADPTTGRLDFAYDHILQSGAIPFGSALLLFGAFFLAFAIKVPVFPFHTWLPDAHVEAPTPGSVILAAILLIGAVAVLGAFTLR
jgi:NADH-quinone oxidoreductase subunit M